MLAVAAVSARALAEAAAADGLAVVALDLFGDVDTRRAAGWQGIGSGAGLEIDGERFLAALRQVAREAERDGDAGWIAGAGFEGRPELVEQGAALLPYHGTAPADLRAVRDPRQFFAALDAEGLAHPAVRFEPPRDAAGWLLKDAAGCGGVHVRRAAADAPPVSSGLHWQAERRGVPMSATLLGNGRQARVLGINRQLVQALGDRPFVFAGLIGPLPLPGAAAREVERAAQRLVARFCVRGLASLDFLLVDGRPEFLELNPRPPASLSLYPRIDGHGPVTAHLRACRDSTLPAAAETDGLVRGLRIVFSPGRRTLSTDEAAALAARSDLRDIPAAGTAFAAGDPVCTVVAQGRDAAAVRHHLQTAHDALLASWPIRSTKEAPEETPS